jgi:hypothetical protein
MIKKLFFPVFALAIALSLSVLTLAQGSGSTTLTGSIVDKACSGGLANKEKAEAHAANHSGSKGCALKEPCANSGLGVYADGKYYEFDAAGAALAKATLEKSSKEKGAKFKVVGKVSEGKMTVESITEVN